MFFFINEITIVSTVKTPVKVTTWSDLNFDRLCQISHTGRVGRMMVRATETLKDIKSTLIFDPVVKELIWARLQFLVTINW